MTSVSSGGAASPRRRCASRLYVASIGAVFAAAVSVAEGQPSPTSAITANTGASELVAFVGVYRATDPSRHAQIIDRAIVKGTEEMRPLHRRVARRRLRAVNSPIRVLRIEREGDRVVMDLDGERYAAPVSGKTERARDPDGELIHLSFRVVGGSLRGHYVEAGAEKIMSFRLGDDRRLTMDVTVLSDQLPGPIRYQLAFRKQ